jgi:hypothetical protein
LRNEDEWKAVLDIAIGWVLRLIISEDLCKDMLRDLRGEYLPGRVLRDVTISQGPEIQAVVKVSDEGVFVIRLPLGSCGQLRHHTYPKLEAGDQAIITSGI